MIAACLTAAAALPAFLCTPGEPPPPPPARVISADRPVLLAAPLPPEPEPEHTHTPGIIPEPWYSLAVCESGMNGAPRWGYNGSSGYDGGLQFHPNTWTAFGGGEYTPEAWQATPQQQIEIGERVLTKQGWGAWPSCSSKLGLR